MIWRYRKEKCALFGPKWLFDCDWCLSKIQGVFAFDWPSIKNQTIFYHHQERIEISSNRTHLNWSRLASFPSISEPQIFNTVRAKQQPFLITMQLTNQVTAKPRMTSNSHGNQTWPENLRFFALFFIAFVFIDMTTRGKIILEPLVSAGFFHISTFPALISVQKRFEKSAKKFDFKKCVQNKSFK